MNLDGESYLFWKQLFFVKITNYLKLFVKRIIPRFLMTKKLNKKTDNCVLLTFDDGPDPEITPLVLERLKKYNARALFFIAGRRIEKAPYLLNRIIAEGHLVCNHSFIHSNSKQLGLVKYYLDIIKNQKIIKEVTNTNSIYFRPPGGNLSFKSILLPKLIGLKLVMWSMDIKDWKCKTVDEAILKSDKLLRTIVARDIVLLHDDNLAVLNILDKILPDLKLRQFNLFDSLDYLK